MIAAATASSPALQFQGDFNMATKRFGKGLHLLGLAADTPVHRAGQANDNLADLVLANNLVNGGDIGLVIGAVNSIQWCRQYPIRVTERYPNPPIANIKPQTARNNTPYQEYSFFKISGTCRRASSNLPLSLPPAWAMPALPPPPPPATLAT